MKIPYYECNSSGNTFIILYPFNTSKILSPKFIQEICQSYSSEKVDGLILIRSKNKLFSIDYYNNDGSWETFCLNGTICSSQILLENNINIKKIITGSGECGIDFLKNNKIKIELPNPYAMKFNKNRLKWENSNLFFETYLIDNFKCFYIYSGAKHIVIKSSDDTLFNSKELLEKKLKKIRYNKLFLPDGVNVNIYKIINNNTIQVKTYEKGVESMMKSCSSGSLACAFHHYHNFKSKEMKIINDGGESEIIFKSNKSVFISRGNIKYKGELSI